MRFNVLNKFFKSESTPGFFLFTMALLSILWANSPWSSRQDQFIQLSTMTVNEGLMAIFFLLVGLELKRCYVEGELTPFHAIFLPFFAAIGGMLVPALIYICLNSGSALKGWSTPVATDIAFALAVLSLFKHIPKSLRLFLLLLAIFDDLGAILIIAFYYTDNVSTFWLIFASIIYIILWILNANSVEKLSVYLLIGCLLWFTVFKAGIHPTIAGVLLGLVIPHNKQPSTLFKLEHFLKPWVDFLILPLFALVNAGFSFKVLSVDTFTGNVFLGITLGLFIGKQLGIMFFSYCLIKLKLASLPRQTSWAMLYGVAILCGIGFTMSLFLGTLSFSHHHSYLIEVKLGVLVGSILSGVLGASLLSIVFAQKKYLKK